LTPDRLCLKRKSDESSFLVERLTQYLPMILQSQGPAVVVCNGGGNPAPSPCRRESQVLLNGVIVSRTSPTHPSADLFRPTSLSDFSATARAIQWLIGGKLTAAQELLARIYGHASAYALRAALNVRGLPGPFDEDLWDSGEYEVVKSRVSRVSHFVDKHVTVVTELSLERKELLNELHLFSIPSQQRRSLILVKKAVKLIEDERWHWRNAIRFVELYCREFPQVSGLEALVRETATSQYQPARMFEALGLVRAPSLFMAGREVVEISDELRSYLAEVYGAFGSEWPDAEAFKKFAPTLVDAIRYTEGFATFRVEIEDSTPDDVYALEAEINARADKPWELTPLLKKYLAAHTELERVAPVWSDCIRQAFATHQLSNDTAAVKGGPLRSEHEKALGYKGSLYLSFSLEGEDEADDQRCMALWRFRAVFLSDGKEASDPATAEIVLNGLIVEPHYAWTYPDEGTFLSLMEWNNYDDVWGVITHKVLPSNGFRSIEEFVRARSDQSFLVIDEIAASRTLTANSLKAVISAIGQELQESAHDWGYLGLSRNWEDSEDEIEEIPFCPAFLPTVVLVPTAMDKIDLELNRSSTEDARALFSKLNRKLKVVDSCLKERAVEVILYDNGEYGDIGIRAWRKYWSTRLVARP
jgi:hypothetical protein